MAHPSSRFIWNNLNILKFTQFPFRFLVLGGFFFSIALGSIIKPLEKLTKVKIWLSIILMIILIFFNSRYFHPSEWIDITDGEKFSGEEWVRQQTISIYDYLPKTASKAPSEMAPSTPLASGGEADFSGVVKLSDNYSFSAEVKSEPARILLPVYDFPNWKVFVDEKDVITDHDNDLGLIAFDLAEGSHSVIARLHSTAVRTISNWISLFAILAVPAYLTRRKIKI